MEITAFEQAFKETVLVITGYGVAVLSFAVIANIAIPTVLAQMRKWKMKNVAYKTHTPTPQWHRGYCV